MLDRILIANRGEIALRIMRACKQMGKQTVAVYTPIDADSQHLDFADETVCIGHYLSANDIVMAGVTRGCDAVHPGYGLLSENADFARQVEESGMKFIGPTPDLIARLGDKVAARTAFMELGIAPIEGSLAPVSTAKEAEQIAAKIGFPLIIKASFGGGGRGIRRVTNNKELIDQLNLARAEAKSGFGRHEVFIEKELRGARHVEIQILGDGAGHCIALGTRDCSVQRRYQKVLEESPAPNVDSQKLEQLVEQCVAAMSKLQYRSAGTLEFMYCENEFYFLEANTRLQVEHPVTEMVFGADLVVSQLQIADGQALPKENHEPKGHAIECRILAEDENGNPGPGKITSLNWPGGPGVRIDSHLFVGYTVPHQYDSLIGKLVVHGADRDAAISRMQQALNELKITGIPTNVPTLKRLIAHPDFSAVTFDTNWYPI